ncbi:MAG: membrane protein insertion efficiency factor YidD [Rhodospirillaceae bacterium]
MSVAARLLGALVLVYRWTLGLMLGPRCRFLPTCSEYALQALSRHGARRGGWLVLCRLGRCHPWGESGHDPVPHLTSPHRT